MSPHVRSGFDDDPRGGLVRVCVAGSASNRRGGLMQYVRGGLYNSNLRTHTKFFKAEMLCVLPLCLLTIPQACVDHLRLHTYPGASDVLCGPGPSPSSSSHLYYPQFIHREFPWTQSLPLDLSMASPCAVIVQLVCYISGKDQIGMIAYI